MPDNSPYNEKELLARIAAGDEQAFNSLYEQYWPKVYAYIESLVKFPETAEEMVADIFLKLWIERDKLINIQNIGGFLRTVARNKALDFLKTTARKNTLIKEYRAEMVLLIAINPEDRLLDKEAGLVLKEAVAQLSEQRRNIFLLHREEGLSYAEIAEKLNLSPLTVKKTMSTALESIRVFLRTHYKDSLGAFLLLLIL